eukprot:m.74689 g.74689  ORF g.74689 m.74689 type:complete len:1106 (+) comp24690_c0_seq2:102-3419(+)
MFKFGIFPLFYVIVAATDVPGYTLLEGDCAGNNIQIVANLTSPDDCSKACNASDTCVGFTWEEGSEPVAPHEPATSLCIPKSAACEHPDAPPGTTLPANTFGFFVKNTGSNGAAPRPGFALVMKPCNMNADYAPQHWEYTNPGQWPPGSFRPDQPNIINKQTGLCLNSQGGFAGWPARVWGCSTSHEPKFWGDEHAAITSSVWYQHPSVTLSEAVSLASNVSVHGTWHEPGQPLTGSSTGLACLTSSLPSGGDWYFQPNTVGMWFCDGPSPVEWVIKSDPPRFTSASNTSMCLESVPVAPVVPPAPQPNVNPNGTQCELGCMSAPCDTMPFCDTSLSPNARARDLISRLTDKEKGLAMTNLFVPALSQLGLSQSWLWFGEAQHGLLRGCLPNNTCATSFPSLVGIGATGNKTLFTAMGKAISDEARAWFNVKGVGHDSNLAFWAPNINLARNFLWGRNQETPGEDPTINGEYAAKFITAMQEGVPAIDWDDVSALPLKTAPTIKHYLAYDVDCSSGPSDGGYFGCAAPGADRFHFEANIPAADFASYYAPVFGKPLMESKPASIMCSFNTVNGTPACADGMMLNTLARETYGFDGFVVSDCGGIDFLNQGHYAATSPAGAVAKAIKGGCEVECGTPGPWGPGYYFRDNSHEAVTQGLLAQEEVDTALLRKWRTAFRLGLFDHNKTNSWSNLGIDVIHSAEHRALTLSAAEQSMTLLKNKNNILPLKPDMYKKIAVIGPAQNITNDMKGDYSGSTSPILSPGEVLSQRLGANKLVWAIGTTQNETNDIAAAVATVSATDVELVLLFVQDTYVGEQTDRTDIALQYGQQELVKAVFAVGKPIVLVIVAGHTLALENEKNMSDAILYAFLPSEAGGTAIVNTLLGDNAPAGRLPVTLYPRSILFERDPGDMSLRGGPGVTYLHYPKNKTVFPFGFGLSYSTFEFSWVHDIDTNTTDRNGNNGSSPAVLEAPRNFATMVLPRVRVTNTGSTKSAVTIQGFITDIHLGDLGGGAATPPERELFDFEKVLLAPGESTDVELTLPAAVLALPTEHGELVVFPGDYRLAIGGLPLFEGAAWSTLRVAESERVLFSLDALQKRHKESATTSATN